MPQMTGIEFLEQAMDLYPAARRVLLTAYADTHAAIDAINVVDLDHYLLKPWDPPEEKLYPVIDALLDAWKRAPEHPIPHTKVIGHRWSARSWQVRDFLARNGLLLQLVHGRRARRRAAAARPPARTACGCPVVVTEHGDPLVEPTDAELADTLGLTTTPSQEFYDLIVIGGGPAGLAAAVYGASEGLRTVLIERTATGGQAGQSSRIENYLGFPDGVSGGQLADRARRQAEKFGAELITARTATALEINGSKRTVRFADGGSIDAHAVILATGVAYRQLAADGCDELTGRGVYYGAAVSIASECEGEEVYVIGGANSAGQAAMYLSREAKSVTIVVRAPSLEASMSYYLIQQIEQNPKITVRTCTEVHCAIGDRPPGEADPGRQPDRRHRGRHLRPDVHLHRRRTAHRVARRGARPRRPRLHPHRPGPAQRVRLDAGPPAAPPGNQRAGRVRRRRRALRVRQTGRGRGRRRIDGRDAGPPLPGGVMSHDRQDCRVSPTSCAPCSCSRPSPTSSSRCCAPTGTSRTTSRARSASRANRRPASTSSSKGELTMSKLSGGQDIETNRTSQRGVYCGAWRAFTGGKQKSYDASVHVTKPSRFFVMDAPVFATVHEGPVPDGGAPARRHRRRHRPDPPDHRQPGEAAGAGPVVGRADPSAEQSRRGHRAGRGRACAAGSPACAASWRCSPTAPSRPRRCSALVRLQQEVAEQVAKSASQHLSAIETTDREDAVGEWLEDHGIDGGWDIAPTFVEGGIDTDWLERISAVADELASTSLEEAIRWINYTIESELLMNQIAEASKRISALVADAKQYSQMDRAPFQVADVHELLRSTLVMFADRLSKDARQGARQAITVVKEFDQSLPEIPCYPGDLNQVWTNIIDNAIAAMRDEGGTLTIRTCREGEKHGPGRDLRHRARDPRRRARAHLRAVLHHQTVRRRHRPRAGSGVQHRRQEASRGSASGIGARRYAVHRAAAAGDAARRGSGGPDVDAATGGIAPPRARLETP